MGRGLNAQYSQDPLRLIRNPVQCFPADPVFLRRLLDRIAPSKVAVNGTLSMLGLICCSAMPTVRTEYNYRFGFCFDERFIGVLFPWVVHRFFWRLAAEMNTWCCASCTIRSYKIAKQRNRVVYFVLFVQLPDQWVYSFSNPSEVERYFSEEFERKDDACIFDVERELRRYLGHKGGSA